MSISGPCLWLPSPIPSHLATVTAFSSKAAGSAELIQQTAGSVPSVSFRPCERGGCSNTPPVEMRKTALKNDNALPSAELDEESSRPQSAGGKALLKDEEKPSPRSGSDTLSRMKLHKLNCSEPVLSMRRDITSPADLTPDSAGEHLDWTQETAKEHRDASTPSDEGTVLSAGGEHQKTPSEIKADKKKMKRFR
jgi:hypothetical protein